MEEKKPIKVSLWTIICIIIIILLLITISEIYFYNNKNKETNNTILQENSAINKEVVSNENNTNDLNTPTVIEETEKEDESNYYIIINGTYSYKDESKDNYYSSELIISNQTSDSINFSISAVHGKDIDNVNIGEVNGLATKTQVPDELVDPNAKQYAYQFVDKTGDSTNKITLVYTNHKGIEYVSVIEKYENGINPYGGAGVYFAADYEKE